MMTRQSRPTKRHHVEHRNEGPAGVVERHPDGVRARENRTQLMTHTTPMMNCLQANVGEAGQDGTLRQATQNNGRLN